MLDGSFFFWFFYLRFQPEMDGVFVRKVQLDELAMDQLVAQEGHTVVEDVHFGGYV